MLYTTVYTPFFTVHVIVKHKASMLSMAMKLPLRPAALLVKVATELADVVSEVGGPFNPVELDSGCSVDCAFVVLTVDVPKDADGVADVLDPRDYYVSKSWLMWVRLLLCAQSEIMCACILQ